MIDIHCHILPSVDDGSDSIETSLEMLKIASEDGVKTIFATPHFSYGEFEVPYKEVIKLTENLNNKSSEKGIDVKVIPGQEIFLDNNTLRLYKEEVIGCFLNTNYMLIELPMDHIPKHSLDTIYELKIRGVKPILAHPERYIYVIENPEKLNDFIEEGCLFQINSGSINGIFGKKVKKTAEYLVKNGVCHFVASDAHGIGTRLPTISNSINSLLAINKNINKLIQDNTNFVIENKDISQKPERIKVKKSFPFIFGK